MKAMIVEKFGGPEVLHVAELPEPHPGAGQVRVRIKAVGVNPFETKVRCGAMEAMFHTALPAILGSEIAGVVDEVGAGAGFALGDEVFGWAETGAYAEFALAKTLARKPPALAWDAAVALPVAGETAERGLTLLAVAAGETVLIHGGASAVGAIAVQLAVQRGATVIATASESNHDYLRSLGARPLTYGAGLVARVAALELAQKPNAPFGIDAVFDVTGKGALPDSLALRGSNDRVLTIADPDAGKLGVRFSSGTAKDRSAEALAGLAAKVVAGTLLVTIAAHFPLADTAAAHAMSAKAHHRGKIVLVVS